MKTWTTMAAAVALMVCAGVVAAADKPAKSMAKTVRGEITVVGTGDTPDITVQPMVRKGAAAKEAVVVKTTADTVVTGNGDMKTAKDLKVGQKVTVTYDAKGENAAKIAVYTPKHEGEHATK